MTIRAADLTIEEKALLLEGVEAWKTHAIPRLGGRSLFLTDGPHGLRKVREAGGGFSVADNVHSTAFPTAVTLASSWNPDNAHQMGVAIARECVAEKVDLLLGPGINIKRSPLCGRNFEYFSEDPLVSGAFGAAFVRGVQSQGVGTSVKHFAVNSNEDYRFVGDSVVDERALREIYLRAFERVVKDARPTTVMTSYNRVNGVYASENHELLTQFLRDEWGFDGAVMTDWGGTRDRVAAVMAGCDLDMPGEVPHNRRSIIAATRNGTLPASVLDQAVERMLVLQDRCVPVAGERGYDPAEHARLSARIAADGAVLLANDGTLPLSASGVDRLLVVGEMFERMRFQGAGSSLINPPEVITPQDAFDARDISYTYAKGYRAMYTEPDPALEREALDAASDMDTVLFFGGLTDLEESEGFDRETMALGENQVRLLEGLVSRGKKVVLVLFAGAPVEPPFADDLAAILNMYLPGMHGGEATASLLFGEMSPSGKTTESWPLTVAGSSCFADFGHGAVAKYYESIYVGYRYYDKAGTTLRYPFGHGLSYTTFDYRDLHVSQADGTVTATLTVANTGTRDGSEVVQLYVGNNRGQVFKADKELRAFTKVFVPAGGSATAELTFALDDLAYWDIRDRGWVLEEGDYEVIVAASASDIRLRSPLAVDGRPSSSPYPADVDRAYAQPPATIPAAFPRLLGRTIVDPKAGNGPAMERRLIDARGTLLGRLIYRGVLATVRKDYDAALAMPDSLERDTRVKNTHFLVRMMPFNSLRAMAMSSAGRFPYEVAAGIDRIAAGHPIQGLRIILTKQAPAPGPS